MYPYRTEFGWGSSHDVCVPLVCHFWWEAVPVKSNLHGRAALSWRRKTWVLPRALCLVGQARRPLSGASARLPPLSFSPPPSGRALDPPPRGDASQQHELVNPSPNPPLAPSTRLAVVLSEEEQDDRLWPLQNCRAAILLSSAITVSTLRAPRAIQAASPLPSARSQQRESTTRTNASASARVQQGGTPPSPPAGIVPSWRYCCFMQLSRQNGRSPGGAGARGVRMFLRVGGAGWGW